RMSRGLPVRCASQRVRSRRPTPPNRRVGRRVRPRFRVSTAQKTCGSREFGVARRFSPFFYALNSQVRKSISIFVLPFGTTVTTVRLNVHFRDENGQKRAIRRQR